MNVQKEVMKGSTILGATQWVVFGLKQAILETQPSCLLVKEISDRYPRKTRTTVFIFVCFFVEGQTGPTDHWPVVKDATACKMENCARQMVID